MNDKRLEKVVLALSGRERALLFLREYKDGLTTQVTTPSFPSRTEHNEYARLVNVIRVCNNEFADVVLLVKEQLAQDELRFHAMQLICIAADDLWMLGKYLKECVPEPVTADEAKARRREPRCGFDVGIADDVAVLRENRQLVQQLTSRGYRLKLPLDLSGDIPTEPKREIDRVRLIAVIVRDNLASAWQQLKAVDTVAAKHAEDLGEDPFRPKLRTKLDEALASCRSLRDELVEYIGPWDLPEELGDSLALIRKLEERALQ